MGADVVAILDSVGIKADEAKLDALFADVDKLECSVDDAIAQGMSKLSVIPSGGGGGDGTVSVAKEVNIEKNTDAVPDDDDDTKSSSVRGGGLFTDDDSSSEDDSDED